MRKLIVSEFMTLDGVMQAPGGPDEDRDAGKRLFADGTTPTALELIDTKTTSRGVVVHVYHPSGRPEYGSALLTQEGDVVKGVTSSRTP